MPDKLTIDKEFSELCPPLSFEERNLLEASIEQDGCREAIVTWANHDDTVLDGHNRYDICKALGRDYKTRPIKLADRQACIEWIIANQLGRRNLSDEQKEYLRGKRYLAEKKEKGGDGSNQHKQMGQNDPIATADKLAKEYNVSPATIKRDAKFATAVDSIAANNGKEVKAKILSGQSGLTKKEVVAIAEQPAETQAKALANAKSRKASNVDAPKTGGIKTEVDKLIEGIEKLVEKVNRLAAHQMGHNKQSAALVDHLQGAVHLVKAMHKSWRNK